MEGDTRPAATVTAQDLRQVQWAPFSTFFFVKGKEGKTYLEIVLSVVTLELSLGIMLHKHIIFPRIGFLHPNAF